MNQKPDSLDQKAETPCVRIAVKDQGGERVTFATFEGPAPESFQVSMAMNAPHKGIIEDCAKKAAATPNPSILRSDEAWLQELVKDISARIVALGFDVEELPTADVSLNFEFDMRSGTVVGRSQILNPYVDSNEDINRSVGEAISKAFNSGAQKLLAELDEKLSRGAHAEAAAFISDDRNAQLAIISRSNKLLDAIDRIDRSTLGREERLALQRILVTFAGNQSREDLALEDGEAILRDDDTLKPDVRVDLQTFIGVGAIKKGRKEYALSIWRALLSDPSQLSSIQRGWLWRNISRSLDTDDPQALKAAQDSADAFLEAGDKRESAKSLKQISHILERTEPHSALKIYDRMLALIFKGGIMDDEICANILHGKARKLLAVGNPGEGFKAAKEAVRLRRGLIGAELALISSMHLAAICARNAGLDEEFQCFDGEAKQLEAQVESRHFAIAREVQTLFETFNEDVAERLLKEAKTGSDSELYAGVSVAIAITDPRLKPIQRIGRLEESLIELERRNAPKVTRGPARLAIAQILRDRGEYARAADWYRQFLADDPLDKNAKELLVDSLWQAKDWRSAATFIEGVLNAQGEMPGWLHAYGKSLFEDGRFSESVTALTKALHLADDDAVLQENIRALRDMALAQGGTIIPETKPFQPNTRVSLEYVQKVFEAFNKFISSSKRMDFWEKPDKAKDYQWISSPERHAQTLLHTFAKGHFFDSVEVFEELGTGAGRLDILLRFVGGQSVIVELKMCGFRYSTNYAASGETQVRHYMTNRDVHVGYLVVFDARLQNNGQALLKASDSRTDTVHEILIDVRPRVSAE